MASGEFFQVCLCIWGIGFKSVDRSGHEFCIKDSDLQYLSPHELNCPLHTFMWFFSNLVLLDYIFKTTGVYRSHFSCGRCLSSNNLVKSKKFSMETEDFCFSFRKIGKNVEFLKISDSYEIEEFWWICTWGSSKFQYFGISKI